ncbi:MAG: N-acetylmuramoyl-L-alanine amidase [Christensenellaceae bacterium]|jgi:N-acetylmuramoyl-L-alanine amidase|nr:N-acetylmuramoyl-L-alanine amidase [Christensenellaceae bacterium]
MKCRFSRAIFCICLACAALFVSAVAFALPKTALALGDHGEEVRALQENLAAAGLYGGEISGVYGADTLEAVQQLQRLLQLEPDGIYGAVTAAAFERAAALGQLPPTPETEDLPLLGRRIGIDPGHQRKEDLELEPMLPGSNRTKARMSRGALGVKTGVPEYHITLLIAQKLQAMLLNSGATVVLTRDTNDVVISNRERAQLMNDAQVDIWIRLHCDASSSSRNNGAHMLVPSRAVNTSIYKPSLALGRAVLDQFCQATGAAQGSVSAQLTQTGFNWSVAPVIALEMGYLSNAEDDVRLNRDSYQQACAAGIYNGIVQYYAEEPQE